MNKAKLLIIPLILCLAVGGFIVGGLCRYDQLEIGLAIPIHNGQVFTPESWDNAVANASYSVVGIDSEWKWPWAEKTVQFIDGITLLSDPRLGVLGFDGTIRFGDGVFTLPDNINMHGDIIGNNK